LLEINSWKIHLGAVHCLVTTGPTIEPLDEVRRFTNHSTGRLGCELTDALTRGGHQVTLLLSKTASHHPRQKKAHIIAFSTTADLRHQLRAAQSDTIKAVFHVAAVSDYRVSCIRNAKTGSKLNTGKISSQKGPITVELTPTPKIIRQLHRWYPKAKIIGWKYEVDGNRENAIAVARDQIKRCRTNACVANGPGYGEGFALVSADGVTHSPNVTTLLKQLVKFLQ
jgi:phosphopantothenoylcysteine decarboxylase/phosphopantothenate--cysteine ligase